MTNKANDFYRALATAAERALCLLAVLSLLAMPAAVKAQTAGEGTLTGTVTDSTGAAIPNATVTATNAATNVSTTRTTSGSGDYTIAPLLPGIYSVQVSAKGFKTLRQQNLDVVALGTLAFNPVMTLGEATETVTVTAAPPVLDTSDATVGMVMENKTYSSLPLQMNQAQRDPTAFAALAPGAQAGIRTPIIGGIGNYLGQLYLDGMPAETINQQGDNRLVSQAMSVDAVDQFQVVTSTPPAEYAGAGAQNYTMKSGGNKYHGQVSDFVRNTIFDAWGFTAKAVTVTNAQGQKVIQPKPAEHQNELSMSVGGKVPHTGNKLFFFFAWDKFHSRTASNPTAYTIPTTLMNAGDFTELNGGIGGGGLSGISGDPSNAGANPALIYDPTTNSCVGAVCTRTPFQGVKNGVPTYNVIPTGSISPIALKMASFMPAPTNPAVLVGNYLGGYPKGFDNHVVDYRVDYDVSSRQRISTVAAIGTVRYLQNYSAFLPGPYVTGTIANIFPKVFDVEDAFTINSRMTNQLKYGFTRFPQPQVAAGTGNSAYTPSSLGITNVVAGQASTLFPASAFGATGGTGKTGTIGTAMTGWSASGAATSTQLVTPSTYAVVDNLQWLKGKHAFSFGFTYEWEQANSAAPVGYSGRVGLSFNSNSTAQYTASASTLSSTSGLSYASYLLGAVGGSPSIGLQPVSELGGRYRVASPYAEDTWKVSQKLTVNLGIRWDYFSPYHEVKDRWTFLNPTITNPATGTLGMDQFAGNYGGTGVSCGCHTPVQTYWKNFGPRIGFAYAVDDKTVIRGGLATVFSQAGGVGGRGGNYNGTGQLGFNVSANGTPESTSGSGAGPSFYLNNGATWTSKGIANTDLLGKGFAYPANPTPNLAAQELNTGNYLNGVTGTSIATAGGVSLADSYISGRAPEFTFFNIGFERTITKDMTLAVNYAGDESHFLGTGSNVRGYWANQLNPVYLAALGGVTDSTGSKPILISAATAANVAKAQSVMSSLSIPAFFVAAANANTSSSTLTMAQGLAAFPQYSGVSDLWGSNVGNLSYHSLQITLLQRLANGLTFNVNYTYSKNIGDDGTFRSGFNIPGAAISGGGHDWHQDRIDRSWTAASAPEALHAFGVYDLPFGKSHLGGDSMLMRTLAGGWQLSGIYTYQSGAPVNVTSSHCAAATNFPGQGTCMPDLVSGATSARVNGSYGTGPNGTNTCNLGLVSGCVAIKYFDASKFALPAKNGSIYLIGNAPRAQPLNLRNPGTQNVDAALHRSFSLPREIGTLVFEVDCLNVWNKVTMSGPNTAWNDTGTGGNHIYPTAFGTIGSASTNARDFQFAGHFNF